MIVYALSDPRDGEIRYVGQTRRTLKKRFSAHLQIARHQFGNRTHVINWIRSVLADGQSPEANVLSVCQSQKEMDQKERHWISALRQFGSDLTNAAIGGSGNPGWHHSEETKERWRKERRAHKSGHFGKRHSEAVRQASRERAAKRILEKGHPMAGKKHSEETRAKIREAIRFYRVPKQPLLPEITSHMRKCRAHQRTGWTHSEETKARMRESALRRMQSGSS